jgi:murein DD-endopeptidase MepM/ murein hydrolase activator NlpD
MRRQYSLLVTGLVTISMLALSSAARAQVDLPDPTASSTTTTTEPGSTTTTTSSPPPTLPSPTTPSSSTSTTTTSTTVAGGGGTSSPSSTSTTAPAVGGDGAAPTADQVVPPEFIPMINSVKRTPPNSTNNLLLALRPLVDLGMSPTDAAVVGFGRFPVAGVANWADDWWTPRFSGTFHLHQGNDIMAAMGTPVRAPSDGVLRQSSDTLGGTTVYVTQPDGTFYYMAHLSAYAANQVTGQAVKTGDVVGFVGNTGDAAGGAPHLHFEIHPKGGAATDPKPFLDQWVADAIANAPQVIAGYVLNGGPGVNLPRHLADLPAGALDGPEVPARTQLAWASAANPSGGTLRLAEAVAQLAADDIDWSKRTPNP